MMPTDDREQEIHPLTPRSLRAVAQGPDPSRAAMARYLRQAVTAESQRWTAGRMAGGVAAAALIVALLVFLMYFRVLRGSQPLIAFIALAILVHLVFRSLAARKISGELATTAVASGLCGQCGYTLADLDAQNDGCVVCPECGAAWRSIRIIAPHWVHADPRRVKRPRGSKWWVRFVYLVPKNASRLGPDDRGRIVPILDSRLRALATDVRAGVPAEDLRRLTRRLRWNGRLGRVFLGLPPMLLGGLTLWGGLRELMERRAEVGLAVFFLGMGLLFVFVGVLMNLGHSFYSPRRAARVFAEQGRCASCAADLRTVPAGVDGLAQCPQCASAWRLPDGVRAGAISPGDGAAAEGSPTPPTAPSHPAPAP